MWTWNLVDMDASGHGFMWIKSCRHKRICVHGFMWTKTNVDSDSYGQEKKNVCGQEKNVCGHRLMLT